MSAPPARDCRPVNAREDLHRCPPIRETKGGASEVARHTENARAALARLRAGAPRPGDIEALSKAAREGSLRLIGGRGGRHPIDDSAALAEVAAHVEEGSSVWRATRLVARASHGHSGEAVAARLRRKFKKNRNKTN